MMSPDKLARLGIAIIPLEDQSLALLLSFYGNLHAKKSMLASNFLRLC
jgi:hypothetical protein